MSAAPSRSPGASRSSGSIPIEWVLSMLAAPERWREEPIVKVTHAGLREAAGLPAGKDRYSFTELVGHAGFLKAAEAAPREAAQGPRGQARSGRARGRQLYETLSLMASIFYRRRAAHRPASQRSAGHLVFARRPPAGARRPPCNASAADRGGRVRLPGRRQGEPGVGVDGSAQPPGRAFPWHLPRSRRASRGRFTTTASSRSGAPGSCTCSGSCCCLASFPLASRERSRWAGAAVVLAGSACMPTAWRSA